MQELTVKNLVRHTRNTSNQIQKRRISTNSAKNLLYWTYAVEAKKNDKDYFIVDGFNNLKSNAAIHSIQLRKS